MNLSREDIEVISGALALYLKERRRAYHQEAANTTEERALTLSVAYQGDRKYVSELLDRLGETKMDDSPSTKRINS